MNLNPDDPRSDDVPAELSADLERHARWLDAQRFPGAAWSPARAPRRRIAVAVAVLAGAAAVLCAVALRGPGDRMPDATSAAPAPSVAVTDAARIAQVFEDSASPDARLVIVEDLDCYTVIDVGPGATVLSFATKHADDWLSADAAQAPDDDESL